MSYNDDLLASLNVKIERLAQSQKDLKEIKELLKEANRLKRFELKMKYPAEFRDFEIEEKRESYRF